MTILYVELIRAKNIYSISHVTRTARERAATSPPPLAATDLPPVSFSRHPNQRNSYSTPVNERFLTRWRKGIIVTQLNPPRALNPPRESTTPRKSKPAFFIRIFFISLHLA